MYTLVLLCATGVLLAGAAKPPKGIELCKYDDNKCLLRAINKAIPGLHAGDAKTHLNPFDPLEVSRISIDQGDSKSPVAVKLQFINSKLYGNKDAEIFSIKGATKTPKGFKLEFTGAFKFVRLVGQYEVSGKILILPLVGSGDFNMDLYNVTFEAALIGEDEPVIKNGKEYLKLKLFDFKFIPSKMALRFEGLHNGDKVLGDSTNAFLNENWRDIYAELKPSFDAAFSGIYQELASRFFDKIPYSDLFRSE